MSRDVWYGMDGDTRFPLPRSLLGQSHVAEAETETARKEGRKM